MKRDVTDRPGIMRADEGGLQRKRIGFLKVTKNMSFQRKDIFFVFQIPMVSNSSSKHTKNKY